MKTTDDGERRVKCPSCGGPALYSPKNPWRPFCTERCRQRDLGAWASEDYRVGSQEPPDEFDDIKPGPASH